jgi:hypothetical protein
MKLQPTHVKESDSTRITWREAARFIRLWRRLGAQIKRCNRADGKAYLAFAPSFSSTLILTK